MWTLNGIRIFVQENTGDGSQIIPRLQPLNGATVLQFFGYESEVKSINAHVIGDTDKNALMALRKTGTAYELISPMGDLGDYYVKKAAFKQINNICQTLRPDLDEDAPYYIFDLELYPTSD
jgi:hypothetical protein